MSSRWQRNYVSQFKAQWVFPQQGKATAVALIILLVVPLTLPSSAPLLTPCHTDILLHIPLGAFPIKNFHCVTPCLWAPTSFNLPTSMLLLSYVLFKEECIHYNNWSNHTSLFSYRYYCDPKTLALSWHSPDHNVENQLALHCILTFPMTPCPTLYIQPCVWCVVT